MRLINTPSSAEVLKFMVNVFVGTCVIAGTSSLLILASLCISLF
jgi:hypothetical protein